MNSGAGNRQSISGDVVDQILKAISGVRYGAVHIIIHDSKVVQIDKTEKVRFSGRSLPDPVSDITSQVKE